MRSVSVVIPTVGRASVREAVESILAQQDCIPEPIVVLDAPERLASVQEHLVGLPHVLRVTNHTGAAHARNVGLSVATGEYLGYLDDDDVWLPTKAISQIGAIENSLDPENTFAVAASEFVRTDGRHAPVRPRRYDPRRSSFPNYLVARRSPRYGSVYFNTPAVLGRLSFMQGFLWDEELRKHQDWDLLIRMMAHPEASVVQVDQPLIQIRQGSRGSISSLSDWRHGVVWLAKHDEVVTGRARADFILLHILIHAFRANSREGTLSAIQRMNGGVPHLGAVLRFVAGLILNR